MHQLTQLRISSIVVLSIMALLLTQIIQSPPPIQAHSAKTPILLIPGFIGTTLVSPDIGAFIEDLPDGHGGKYSHSYPANEEIWINKTEAVKLGFDDYFDVLKLEQDGKTPVARLGRGMLITDIYQPTIDYFAGKGYLLNRDFYVFPYDWRMDIRDNNEQLNDLIELIKVRTGQSKINIIAHSMGGLILRNYIADPQQATNIDQAVTLGTPFLGSPEMVKWLMYGGCLKFPVGPSCLSLSSSETKDILQNMPPAFQLLPSQKYYDLYHGQDAEHPYPFNDQRDVDGNGITGELSYLQFKEMLTNLQLNTTLFEPAEQLHNAIDNTSSNVHITNIVGSGKPTLGQIEEKNTLSIGNLQLNKKDEHIINGDNTVPTESAIVPNNTNIFYANQEHAKLPADPNVLSLVNFLFNGDPAGTYNYNGITTTPTPLKGHLISVHSPVTLNIYGPGGTHTGPNDFEDFEQEIPGSTYDTIDDAKFAWLPDDGQYVIRVQATDEGSFDLKIRDYKNNQLQGERDYLNIPLTINTSGIMELNTAATTDPILTLDSNADGENDLNITPTTKHVTDAVPPTTQINISGKLGDNEWFQSNVTVTLTATDNQNGSGVKETYYQIGHVPAQLYTQPITITQEGGSQLYAWSIDNQGNTENKQFKSIRIDKTAPEIATQYNPVTQKFDFSGSDNLTNTYTNEVSPGELLTQDEAGNKIHLTYSPKNKKKKDSIEIEKFQYNNETVVIPLKNQLKIESKLDTKTNKIKQLHQKLTIKDDTKIEAEFKPKQNMTIIEQKLDDAQKEKYEFEGLKLIRLFTTKGQLSSEISL